MIPEGPRNTKVGCPPVDGIPLNHYLKQTVPIGHLKTSELGNRPKVTELAPSDHQAELKDTCKDML